MRPALLHHVPQALARILRVQWHIGATGLEDRQQANDHFHRSLDGNRDQHIRPDAHCAQLARQAVGALIELAIAQGLLGKQQCRGLRGARDLHFEQLGQAALMRVLHLGTVPVVDDALSLFVIEHLQFTDRGIGVLHQAFSRLAKCRATCSTPVSPR